MANPRSSTDRRRPAINPLKPSPYRASGLVLPFKEAVEAICGDLGLEPDWSRWTDNGWPSPLSARQIWDRFWPLRGRQRTLPKLQ